MSALAGPRLLGPRLTVRQLSMTGPATFSSLLTTDKPYASNRRTNPIRLAGEQIIPVPEATETGNKVRRFNTSRSRKAIKDSSTMDFTYIPDFDPETRSAPLGVRVPILPWADVQGHSSETDNVVCHALIFRASCVNDMMLTNALYRSCSQPSTPLLLMVPTSTPPLPCPR